MIFRIAFIFIVGIFVFTVNSMHIPGFVNGKPLRHYLDNLLVPDSEVDISECPVEEKWFVEQLIDHFDEFNLMTYKQRYLVNNKFFDDETDEPVIFLLIGGEETITEKLVCWENYTYMKLAAQNNASVIQLEHRFFGYSNPVTTTDGFVDVTVETLQFLTSQQTLADIANFIASYNQQQNWTNPRWVVFGGSYPGSLCAWFRAQHPDLTVGGICSSAPLWPKVDFYEYAEVMEYAINDFNSVCGTNLSTAFTELKQMLYTDAGRSHLNTIFKVQPPLNASSSQNFELDATNFLAKVFNPFQGIVQYTFDAVDNNTILGITGLCDIITKPLSQGSLVDRIAEIYFWSSGRTYLYNNYSNEISHVAINYYNISDPFDREVISADRAWMWLCCGMALGWLQSTDTSRQIFSHMLPLQYHLQMCQDIFGTDIDANYISQKVENSNLVFGSPWNYNATNVVLTNGDYDPWSSLGSNVTRAKQHQYAVKIPKAAHCSDMYPARAGEPAGLEHARAVIQRQVEHYLTSALINTPIPTTSTTTTLPSTSSSPSSSSILFTSSIETTPPETTDYYTVFPHTTSEVSPIIIETSLSPFTDSPVTKNSTASVTIATTTANSSITSTSSSTTTNSPTPSSTSPSTPPSTISVTVSTAKSGTTTKTVASVLLLFVSFSLFLF